MSKDHSLTILLAVASILGGIFTAFAPTTLPKSTSIGTFYMGGALTLGFVCAAIWTSMSTTTSNIAPAIGMILSAASFVGSAAWAFSSPEEPAADRSDRIARLSDGEQSRPPEVVIAPVNQSGGQTAATINNFTTVVSGPSPQERETERRRRLVQEILMDYISSHDGIAPLLREQLNQAETFINEDLERRGEPWRLNADTKRALKLPQ